MKNLTPVTREEKYLHAIATHGEVDITPTNKEEELLDAILNDETIEINPKTRKEWFLAKVAGATIISNEDSEGADDDGGKEDAAL